MILPELYLDEDVQSEALIKALRSRGVVVVTTSEAGNSHNSDEKQLSFAALHNSILVTSNIHDFARLHKEWLEAKRPHSGILLIHQQKWGPGELARKIIRLLTLQTQSEMTNRIEFLSNW